MYVYNNIRKKRINFKKNFIQSKTPTGSGELSGATEN